MQNGSPDRPPLFTEGMRSQTLRAWRAQGMPKSTALSELFEVDERDEIEPDLWPKPYPSKWPRSLEGLADLESRLDPFDRRLPGNWRRRVKDWQNGDSVVMLRVQRGFFQSIGIQDWSRFHEAMFLLADEPRVVQGMMEIQGEFCARVAERVLNEVQVDAAVFSEPISGNHGPLISPRMYRELVLPGYQPILDVLNRGQVRTIIFRTYSNSRALIPCILEAGFNCLWAVEVAGSEMDYRSIRREFGSDLRLIGGIDLDALHGDRQHIQREIEEKVIPLLEQGGFIPLADGRVRADVKWENYRYYRKLLERAVAGWGMNAGV